MAKKKKAEIDEEDGMVTCEWCGKSSHFDEFGSVQACGSNMFCPHCEAEVNRDGKLQLLCGEREGCRKLRAYSYFAKVQGNRKRRITARRKCKQ